MRILLLHTYKQTITKANVIIATFIDSEENCSLSLIEMTVYINDRQTLQLGDFHPKIHYGLTELTNWNCYNLYQRSSAWQ